MESNLKAEMESKPSAQSFRDLLVWQRSIQLATAIYRLTQDFPRDEMYGLTSQMRRAAVSIASNIAEGQGRLSTGEFQQFLGMARGSSFELQTQLEVARSLGIGSANSINEAEALSLEIGKMINGLLKSLKQKSLTTNH
jgi:four helix bundle protein